jgi:hypothetical protein
LNEEFPVRFFASFHGLPLRACHGIGDEVVLSGRDSLIMATLLGTNGRAVMALVASMAIVFAISIATHSMLDSSQPDHIEFIQFR